MDFAIYKIPRKRVRAVIIFKDNVFQNESDFRNFLETTAGFSSVVTDSYIEKVMSKESITKEEMADKLISIGVYKKYVPMLLEGKDIPSNTTIQRSRH